VLLVQRVPLVLLASLVVALGGLGVGYLVYGKGLKEGLADLQRLRTGDAALAAYDAFMAAKRQKRRNQKTTYSPNCS